MAQAERGSTPGVMVEATYSDRDRKSTRLNSSHITISYAVFCLKKKNEHIHLRIHFCVLWLRLIPQFKFYKHLILICSTVYTSDAVPLHHESPMSKLHANHDARI